MVHRLLILLLSMLVPATAAAQDRIDRLVASYLERERIPGAVLVVLRGDRVAMARAWGVADRASGTPMRADGIQPIYSISKHVTAALILRLAEQGRIELDAPVGRYLPRWFAGEPELRVHHLLRQTSGLANFVGTDEAIALDARRPDDRALEPALDLIARAPRRFAPGARYAYSNSNFTVLAAIAEQVGGAPFATLQQRELFAPAGLAMGECADLDRDRLVRGHRRDGAAFVLPSNLAITYAGNGGLCTDALTLARWTRALMRGRVIGHGSLRRMHASRRVAAGYRPAYGMGLMTSPIAGHAAFAHAGADDGWGAWTSYLPDQDLIVVLLVNRGWFWATDLAVPIIRALTGQPEPPVLRRLPIPARERALLTGTFEDGLFAIRLTAQADRIVLDNPAFGAPIELWRQAPGRFVSAERPDTFGLRLQNGRPVMEWMGARAYLLPAR